MKLIGCSLLPSLHLASTSILALGLIPEWKMGDTSHDILVTQGAALSHILSSRNLGSDAGFALWPEVSPHHTVWPH